MNDSFTSDYGNSSVNLSIPGIGQLRLGRDGAYYDEQGNKYGISYSASYGGDSGGESSAYLIEKAAKPPAWPTPKYADTSSEYWAYDDPRWAQQGAGVPDPYPISDVWDQLLRQAGFAGELYQPNQNKSPNPWIDSPDYERTPEAKAAMDQLRAAGYDVRQKHPDRRTFNTYYGLVTPGGGIQDIKIRGSDLGDAIMPAIKVFGAGLGLAGLGAGINSLLGGAGAGAGAGAGSALGIAEAMAPGVLAPATAAEMAGVNALLSGGTGALTAADLANLPADVLGQSGQIQNVVTPAAAASDAAAIEAMQFENALLPSSQTNVAYPYGGELPYVNPTQATVGTVPGGSVGTPIISDYSVAANTLESMGIPATPENINALLGIDTAGVATTASSGGISALDQAMLDMGAGATNIGTSAATAGGMSALDQAMLDMGAGAAPVATAPAAVTPATAATTAPAAATVAETVLPAAAATGAGAAGGGTETLSALDQAALDMGAGATNVGAATGGGSILDQVISFFRSPAGGAALSGLGSVIGGITQANAAQSAADQQAEAARNALALQREMFEYQKGLLEPYRTAGTAALERLSGAMGLGGAAAKPQQALEMDPGYGFRLGEGMKALERMQAARGNMLSGGAMKAGQRYAQDYASGEYQNAYNRLANIAGLGQTTGTQLGTAASQFGQTAGNIMGQEANALAAGRIGRGSAYGNAIQGGLNAYSNYLNQQQQNQLFRDIFGRTAIGS